MCATSQQAQARRPASRRPTKTCSANAARAGPRATRDSARILPRAVSEAFLARVEARQGADVWDRLHATALAQNEVRALVVHDDDDQEVSITHAETLIAAWPHARLLRTHGLGHRRVLRDPAVVDAVQLVRLPYHLSAITQAVARTALAHADELLAQVALLREERDAMAAWLRGLGHEVADSDANFILFGQFDDRHAVWLGLLERGVLIRETGPDRWLRVSIGTPEENAAFRAALMEVTA